MVPVEVTFHCPEIESSFVYWTHLSNVNCVLGPWGPGPMLSAKYKVKVKQSHYRPLGFQEVETPRFLDNRHMKVVRLSALRSGRLYPQEILLVLISVRGWVDPRAIVRPKWLCQWKIPMAPSAVEPATFRLVAQCLNQLRHYVPLPQNIIYYLLMSPTKYTCSQSAYISITCHYHYLVQVLALSGPLWGRKQVQEMYKTFVYAVIGKCGSCLYEETVLVIFIMFYLLTWDGGRSP
jgi:hypothetical protein